MKFTLASIVTSIVALSNAAVVPRDCPEASRFGSLLVVPSTLAVHDSMTIHIDLDCAVSRNIRPTSIQYSIEVIEGNNGHDIPVNLFRREPISLQPIAGGVFDTFSSQIPAWYWRADAKYVITAELTYPVNGTDGKPVFVRGGTTFPIEITGI